MASAALALLNEGRLKEAADAYEEVLNKYSNTVVAPESQFRLGYIYYLLGDLDKSIANLKKVASPAPAPAPQPSPEVQELGSGLLPQVLSAKAMQMKTDDPNRLAAFQDAIKQFDATIQKYPNSDGLENMIYARAVALYQTKEYEKAEAGLRENIAKFPKSESIQDSEYLLAFTLAAEAGGGELPKEKALAKLEEAAKLLGGIVKSRTDVALANDAQFQIGEVLISRANLSDQSEKQALYAKAIEACRAVEPKELMVKAQEARVANVKLRKTDALRNRNTAEFKRLERA